MHVLIVRARTMPNKLVCAAVERFGEVGGFRDAMEGGLAHPGHSAWHGEVLESPKLKRAVGERYGGVNTGASIKNQ